jgi:hypothetical protein
MCREDERIYDKAWLEPSQLLQATGRFRRRKLDGGDDRCGDGGLDCGSAVSSRQGRRYVSR